MNPVEVNVEVPYTCEQVYEFLAVSRNHEPFNRHMLGDWSFSGPARGVGSRTHATALLGGRREPVDIEVVEDVAPTRIVERNIGAGGKRTATGTYTLTPTGRATNVQFVYAWQAAPLAERMASGLVRRLMRRALQTSMRELATVLGSQVNESDSAAK